MEACATIIKENIDLVSQLNEKEFPALPKTGLSRPVKVLGALIPSYKAKTTEVLEIPFEERRFLNNENDNLSAGKRYNVQSKICMEIAKDTNVKMNLNSSKNHILTVIVSGEPSRVAEAKRRVIAELQHQETVRISVPVECRGYLIGRKGERLQELESSTMTRISIPPHNALDPDVVIVTGPKRGILEAEELIYEIVRKQSQQAFERLSIPKIYHPFICGPNNQTVNDLKSKTDTKINIPPPSISVDEITVSGKREGVAQAVKEIQAIYNEQLETTKTITVKVARSQHRIIFGQRGSGIAEILAQTGVSVELPMDDGNEVIVLRGKPEDLGRALSMVYERAQSTIKEEIEAPNRFHRLLIGRGGSKLTELLEGYKRVQVNFGENTDRISVEGPSEEVEVIVERLKSRLAELQATVAMTTVKVDPKYYRHIIGKQGATIGRLRDYKVRVRLPDPDRGDSFACDEIVIEGDPVGVEKAKLEIQQLVERLENEKCKDVIIDPHIQNLLRSNSIGTTTPYIRTIYDMFPQVRIIWPESDTNDSMFEENPTKSIVQLRGDRQQVDAASEKLQKIIKLVKEENYRQEIHIFKEIRSSFLGREYPRVRKILEDTQTRLQHPNPGSNSDIFTVIGREENVCKAIVQLEELQKKLASVKEVIVSIPSALTTKFAGDQAPSLRSICEQCEGVHIRFAHNKNSKGQSHKLSHIDIVVLGPEKEVNQACSLLSELNAKVSELCAEIMKTEDTTNRA
ncbi:Vigilin [Schistosoma japonicum]|uniref:Vigilin n=2 Tax=Schistosoma japonicum TaxID=6182 RepID=A0A4Z2DHW7_SCHJA|nr:Vigilin [Schistosoma japonicum]